MLYPGDKNFIRPPVNTNEISKGRVILPKALILQEELLEEVILHITPLCCLLHTPLKAKCTGLQVE